MDWYPADNGKLELPGLSNRAAGFRNLSRHVSCKNRACVERTLSGVSAGQALGRY
jgi:hypothetical protein